MYRMLKKIELPIIKFISFYNNKITSPEIFDVINKFKSLEKFYIGHNPIDIKKLPSQNYIYNLPPNLIELGITYNFTKETNSFIYNNLNLENIQIIFVSGDGITSLERFKNIK